MSSFPVPRHPRPLARPRAQRPLPMRSRLIRTRGPYKRIELSGPNVDRIMPARNALARRRPRRYGRRRLYRRVPRTLQPYSIARRLTSVYSTSLDAAAAFCSYAYLNLNSAFDPTGSLTTNLPMGFNQYKALYKRYCVIGYSLKLEFCGTDNTHPAMVGFTPMDDTTKRDLEHYKELPGTVSSIVTPDIDKLTLYARGGIRRRMLPGGGKLLTDSTLSAAVTTNPTRILYGHIWCQPMDTSVDPTKVHVVITLRQTVVFFVPESPARST